MFWETVELDLFSAIFCYTLFFIDICIILRHFRSDTFFCNCVCTYRTICFSLNVSTFYQMKYKLSRRMFSSRLGKFQVLNLCKSRGKEIKFTLKSFL